MDSSSDEGGFFVVGNLKQWFSSSPLLQSTTLLQCCDHRTQVDPSLQSKCVCGLQRNDVGVGGSGEEGGGGGLEKDS